MTPVVFSARLELLRKSVHSFFGVTFSLPNLVHLSAREFDGGFFWMGSYSLHSLNYDSRQEALLYWHRLGRVNAILCSGVLALPSNTCF